MDVFSWFRHKREGRRSGSSDGNEAALPSGIPLEIAIPFEPTPTIGFAVYFYAGETDPNTLPDEPALLSLARTWLETHCDQPLRDALIGFLDEELVTLLLRERDSVPDPPDSMIRAYNPGETEERRYRAATHIVFVGAPDVVTPPRIGFWAVAATARALASGLSGGCIIDPEFPRLLPLRVHDEPIAKNGRIRVVDHILIPYSHDVRTGLLWMTTKGMGRFGLPDLEIRDVPPNLAHSLMPVLNGMAQRLVVAAMRSVESEESVDEKRRAETFAYPSHVGLYVDDIRRAYGERPQSGDTDDDEGEGVRESGSTTVRLQVSRQKGNDALAFVRLLPPVQNGEKSAASREFTGVWLNAMLAELFGAESEIASVRTGDARMEEAHDEALAQLGQVRARFLNGFRSGEVLHIKYGFPVEPSGREEGDDRENREFMWVAVTTWSDGGRIRGNLANDPQLRRDLKAGQVVEISEEDVYDWMIVHGDGRREGAFTNRVLEDGEDDE